MRRRLLAVLQSRIVHVLSFPVVAWVLFAAVNWGWHFSVLYDQALENQPLHYFQHATFLAAALLFWWPAIGADPSPWRLPHPVRLLYLFLAMPQNSFLGVALLSAPTVLYPHYVTNLRDWGPSPLEDQAAGRRDHVGRRRRRLPRRHGAGRGAVDAARGPAHRPPRRAAGRGAGGARRRTVAPKRARRLTLTLGQASGRRKQGVDGDRREEQRQVA